MLIPNYLDELDLGSTFPIAHFSNGTLVLFGPISNITQFSSTLATLAIIPPIVVTLSPTLYLYR